MSAANTGTPAREKPSASTCSVTVLPVPVAPVIRPWRLPKASVSASGFSPLPTNNVLPSSAMARSLASFPQIGGPLSMRPPGRAGASDRNELGEN